MKQTTYASIAATKDVVVTVASGRAFSGSSQWGYRAEVEPDGTVRVYDATACHYTIQHALTAQQQDRVREMAAGRIGAARTLAACGGFANSPAQRAWRKAPKPHAGRPKLAPITDDQIDDLRGEAIQHGDTSQVAICTRALRGSARARRECQRVIRQASR